MGFRNGDGNEEGTDVEKIELPSDEPETKVNLDDAEEDRDDQDDGDQEPEPKAAKDGQPRKKNGTWAEKKKERGQDRKAAKAWESERAEYDRRFKRMQEDNDRTARQLREELDRVRSQGQQGQQRDPLTARLDDIGKQIEKELSLIENDAARGYGEYNKLRREEQRLISMQVMAENAAEQRRQQQGQPRDVYAARRPIIESEYPWVVDDQYRELAQRARAYREYLINVGDDRGRRADTIETDREALSYAQAHFGPEYGLRPPPAPPSQRTRGLYAPPASRGLPSRQSPTREVDLGVMGVGHGLSPQALARAVKEGIGDEN